MHDDVLERSAEYGATRWSGTHAAGCGALTQTSPQLLVACVAHGTCSVLAATCVGIHVFWAGADASPGVLLLCALGGGPSPRARMRALGQGEVPVLTARGRFRTGPQGRS